MSSNPFMFGKVVRGKNFCNRSAEMEKIKQAAISKNSLVIVSPRRYGKTSLIINALEKYQLPFLFVDCFEVQDEKSLLEKIASAYLSSLRKGDVLDKVKYLSKIINVEYSFTVKGITVRITHYQETALRTLLEEITRKYLLVLDEFQELFVVEPQLVKKLRSILQFLPQSIFFLGSKKHLLLYLFSDQRSPFYNFGSLLPLDKIPAPEWKKFIKDKFGQSRITITEQEIEALLEAAELIPFYVQYLCYYYWQNKKDGSMKTFPEFLEEIIYSNSYIYDELYEKLPPAQQKALQIALHQKEKIFSRQTLQEYRISSNQALHKSFTALVEKGFLEKNGEYRFNDPLFKKYLQGKDQQP